MKVEKILTLAKQAKQLDKEIKALDRQLARLNAKYENLDNRLTSMTENEKTRLERAIEYFEDRGNEKKIKELAKELNQVENVIW